ncbi:MAG TPA: presqualene diphosphate synthase HpnD [Caulobacteraceae bacterium]|nr:presqualene diphosphate synthase HpnD [Caulobacteraceae bacterium]
MNAPSPAVQAASGSSFYAAMRILPAKRRAAMFAIYGFCRAVDDIVDEPGPTADEQRGALEAWRGDIGGLFAGRIAARTEPLAGPVADYGLEREDFLAIIDGMEMDVGAPMRGPDYASLDLYCDRVASAVGRLSVRVFGLEREPGRLLAHYLGRALQLTNILRDVDEDAALGRLYLPRESLESAGLTSDEPAQVLADARLDPACRWVARKAHAHYGAADELMRRLPRGATRAPRLMAAVYGRILREMELAGWAAPRRRIKLSKPRLAGIALREALLPL